MATLLVPLLGLLLLLPLAYGDAILEHSTDEVSFHRSGHISIPADASVGSSLERTAPLERQPLTRDQLDALKNLVQRNGLYRLQVSLPGQQPVATSLRAVCMAQHMLDEDLKLHLDEDGSIVGLQVSVPGGSGACSQQQALQHLEEVRGKLLGEPPGADVALEYPWPAPKVKLGVPADAAGPRVGAQPYAPQQGQQGQQHQQQGQGQGQEGQGEEGKEGQPKTPPPDNRTWLQKNFLYVVAGGMLVMNIMARLNEAPQAAAGARPAARPQGGR